MVHSLGVNQCVPQV